MALDASAIKGALGKAMKGELPDVAVDAKSITLVYPSAEMHAKRCSADDEAVMGIVKRALVEQTEVLGTGNAIASVTVRFSL